MVWKVDPGDGDEVDAYPVQMEADDRLVPSS